MVYYIEFSKEVQCEGILFDIQIFQQYNNPHIRVAKNKIVRRQHENSRRVKK